MIDIVNSLNTRFTHFLIDYFLVPITLQVTIMLPIGINFIDLENNVFITEIIFLFYITISEYTSGRSLGKLLTGTKVVRTDGTRVGFWRCLLRSVVRLVPFEFVSILFSPPIAWHDFMSDTRVVYCKTER
jgi:uncharacterized RDD family membrane protein YckC